MYYDASLIRAKLPTDAKLPSTSHHNGTLQERICVYFHIKSSFVMQNNREYNEVLDAVTRRAAALGFTARKSKKSRKTR